MKQRVVSMLERLREAAADMVMQGTIQTVRDRILSIELDRAAEMFCRDYIDPMIDTHNRDMARLRAENEQLRMTLTHIIALSKAFALELPTNADGRGIAK